VSFTTEANGLDIRYTLALYGGPFLLGTGEVVAAQSFLAGKAIGYPVSLDFPVHKAAHQLVINDHQKRMPKLTDLQYARLTPVDPNWLQLPKMTTFHLILDGPKEISSVQFSALRYTISGIYPPTKIWVRGAGVDGKYHSLVTVEQPEVAAIQGRNKVNNRITFPPRQLERFQIHVWTHDVIPAGHHLAGSRGRMYVDELVVR